MTVFIPRTHGAPAEAVARLMQAFGPNPPEDFFQFLQIHDGAEPEANFVIIDGAEECGIRVFTPAAEMFKLKSDIEYFPNFAIPLGYTDVGDYYFININDNGVYLWQHDFKNENIFIAKSFVEFLRKLEPDS